MKQRKNQTSKRLHTRTLNARFSRNICIEQMLFFFSNGVFIGSELHFFESQFKSHLHKSSITSKTRQSNNHKFIINETFVQKLIAIRGQYKWQCDVLRLTVLQLFAPWYLVSAPLSKKNVFKRETLEIRLETGDSSSIVDVSTVYLVGLHGMAYEAQRWRC